MKKILRILFFGFTLIELYRLGKYYENKKGIIALFIKRWCKYKMHSQHSSYISFKASIAHDCKFIHPTGIVIGEGVQIKSNCQIYQGVTLGAARQSESLAHRYPLLESNCIVFAGAKVLGPVTIGENTIVGANAVVLKSIDKNSIAVGIPAKGIPKYEITSNE